MSTILLNKDDENKKKTDIKRNDRSASTITVTQRLVGGTVGGILQALTSHPLDTVKSRVQCGLFPDVFSCCRHTWAAEGLSGFYRGVTPPVVLGGVYNSILFGLNQFMTAVLTPAGFDSVSGTPLWRTALAAQLTAPVYTLCITPMENVKVKLQLQQGVQGAKDFTWAISCIRNILNREGVRGFFSGYTPTVLSRLVGLPFYFTGYQLAKQQLDDSAIAKTIGTNFGVPMVSGCVAGVLFWMSNYPFDFVKTQMQSGRGRRKFSEVFITTYKTGGIRAFYRGYSACLLRALPANASVWVGVEWTTRFMRRNNL